MKRWEKGLILLSMIVFFGSFYLYVTDYPLHRYLFGIEAEGVLEPVGKVQDKQGGVRRQVTGEAGFKSIDDGSVLYNSDTVVTSSDAKATLSFDDGSTLELEPNTMVRLRFVSSLELGGISRVPRVDVFAGAVKAQAVKRAIEIRSGGQVTRVDRASTQRMIAPKPKPIVLAQVPAAVTLPRPVALPAPVTLPIPTPIPPSPSPLPPPRPVVIVKAELLSPANGTRLKLDKNPQVLAKTVKATWTVSPPDTRVQLTLWKKDSAQPQAVFKQVLSASPQGLGEVSQVIRAPGNYEWELRGANGEPISGAHKTRALFAMEPEFEAIELLEPLVGGAPASSNQIQEKLLKNFDITLRWVARADVEQYVMKIKNSPKAKKAVLERTIKGTEYVFNKDQVYSGEIFYQVLAPLKSGFVAVSLEKPFAFTFLAPHQVSPVDGLVLTREQLVAEGNTVLFTWEKTNFTEFYEIEIAQDLEFKKRLLKEKRAENFYILKRPRGGTYYWRVKSFAKNVLSPPSRVSKVVLDLKQKP